GQTATPQIAEGMASAIRGWVSSRFGGEVGGRVRILYGGSVNPDNAGAIMGEPDIDGVLVGGASLDPAKFASIVRSGVSVGGRDV
ncbi:MAG TPA: triose-phosphate isomerase, partial [Candidatus Acetothermia bacterium]|nr:triose-phosphate isomerase [Candidatus Acetothermia bacterium]